MELYSPTEKAKILDRGLPIFPKLGLFSTFYATLIAIYLLPDDPQPAGALFSSALVMSLGLLIAPVASLLKTPKAFLRTENLIAISPIYWLLLDLLQGAYPLTYISPASIEMAFIAIGLFVGAVWIANLLPAWPLPKPIRLASSFTVNANNLFKLILIFFCLGLLRFAYPSNFNPWVMADALLTSRWSAPWMRGQLGGWDSFLDHLSYFGYLLPTLTVLLGLKGGWFSRTTVVSIILSLIFLLFLMQGGGRRIIGVVVGAAVICWFLEQKVIRFRQLVIVGMSLLILLLAMQLMLEFRETGFRAALEEGDKELQYDYLHVDDNFLRMSQIIQMVPESYPFVYEKQIVFVLIRPIPRVLWPGKPVDPGFDLGTILGEKETTLSCSAVGELYLSCGLIGVFIGGLMFGRLTGMFAVLLLPMHDSASTLVYSLASMTLLAGVRSLLELILMSYMLLAWIIVSNFTLVKRIKYAFGRS